MKSREDRLVPKRMCLQRPCQLDHIYLQVLALNGMRLQMLPKIENKVVKTFIEHSSSYHKDNMPSQIRNTFILI